MANTKSAEKRNRQSTAARDRNRGDRSRLRTAIKRLRAAIAAGDAKTASSLLPATLGIIDRTAKKRVIQTNTASRYKSRLASQVHAMSA